MTLLERTRAFGLLLLLAHPACAWYDHDACCALAQRENVFLDISSQDAKCGQTFSLLANNTPSSPAPNAHVSWSFCHSNCPGWGRSKAENLNQWAGPIVQFILPSVIFALTIPRARQMDTRSAWYYTKLIKPLRPKLIDGSAPQSRWMKLWNGCRALCHWLLKAVLIDAVLIFADTIVWIFVIVFLAGPMIVEGLFEALLDFRILQYVQQQRNDHSVEQQRRKVELLLTIVVGNLDLDIEEPRTKLMAALPRASHDEDDDGRVAEKTRLLSMLGTQSIFGAAVGAPVLFYLGAFVYTILDLMNNPSNEDAAIALAFGIEWMIVVHVAIVAGCLLANNNPNTSTAIVGMLPSEHDSTVGHGPIRFIESLTGWSKSYDTIFQPVQMWHRGSNKMKWLRGSQEWQHYEQGQVIRKHAGVLKWYWLCIPAGVLVTLPSIGGAVVAYATPPVGFGCRSLSFICYAACQFILTVKATIELDSEPGSLWPFLRSFAAPWSWFCFVIQKIWWIVSLVYRACPKWGHGIRDFIFITLPLLVVPIVGSLFAGIGGTMMQVIGVFRTCLCYINAQFWRDLDASPGVNLASDNEDQRISSQMWIWAGATATVFMGAACYLGYAYQESLRYTFTQEVHNLYPPDAPQFGTGHSDNIASEPGGLLRWILPRGSLQQPYEQLDNNGVEMNNLSP